MVKVRIIMLLTTALWRDIYIADKKIFLVRDGDVDGHGFHVWNTLKVVGGRDKGEADVLVYQERQAATLVCATILSHKCIIWCFKDLESVVSFVS